MKDLSNIPQIKNLTDEESRIFYSLLSASRNSDSLSPIESIYTVDYEEIPVSIDEFLESDKYLGKVFDNGRSIYPYWRRRLREIFHENIDKAFEVCLTGDTVIPLLDGTRPTIKELAESGNKRRYLYSYDLDSDEYTVGVTSDIWSNGIKPVYQITLDNGESFRLTANHRLLTRDKHWKSIDSGLSVGDSLMPFDTIIDDYGYEDQSRRFSAYNSNPENQRRNRRNKCLSQLNRISNIDGVSESNYRNLLEEVGCKYKPSLEFIVSEFGDFSTAMKMAHEYNHKIVSIDYVGEEEVYDISVEDTHNFAIGAGIVAHNCLTGAIGVGKSTIAAIAMMYQMYRVLCLRDPQKFYKLTNNSPIVFVCLNLTLDLAYSGLYAMIVSALQNSPWFLERCDIRGKYSYNISFPKNVELLCASTVQHVIGKNVIMALMDEINFSNAPKGSQRSVLDMYRNIRRRIESRFMFNGVIRGYIFLISSKNTEQDFLDTYIQSMKGSKSIIVIDEPVYNIKPPETYVGTKFKVAVGDKTKESYIIKDEDNIQEILDRGYSIIEVPIEYKVAFEQDINDALKDIAGISAASTSKLIPYAGRIDVCFDKNRSNPFFSEEIQLGLDSVEDIRDFLDDLAILRKDLGKYRFAHIDIGLKGDRLGLAIVHNSKSISVERYTASGAIYNVSEPVYDIDLLLTIKAISGSEIPLFKVREFLLWLSSYIGFKFMKITFDGFQSADSIQLLQTAGLPSGLLSVDRTDVPYLNLRSCILERRLEGYYHSIVIEELRDLEYDRKNKKVDHPIVRYDGSPGSKDTSDALCGAIYNAQEYYAKSVAPITKGANAKAAMSALQRIENLRKLKSKETDYDWIL